MRIYFHNSVLWNTKHYQCISHTFLRFSWANILNIDLNPINLTGTFGRLTGFWRLLVYKKIEQLSGKWDYSFLCVFSCLPRFAQPWRNYDKHATKVNFFCIQYHENLFCDSFQWDTKHQSIMYLSRTSSSKSCSYYYKFLKLLRLFNGLPMKKQKNN